MYFEDTEYNQFLEEISNLIDNEDEFIRRYCQVNKIMIREN